MRSLIGIGLIGLLLGAFGHPELGNASALLAQFPLAADPREAACIADAPTED
jgi:hypothetical protein